MSKDELLTVKCWIDNNANIHSRKNTTIEVLREEWEAMTEEERWEHVYETLIPDVEVGFTDPLEVTQ